MPCMARKACSAYVCMAARRHAPLQLPPNAHLRPAAPLRQRRYQQAHEALQHRGLPAIQALFQKGSSQAGAGSAQRGRGRHRQAGAAGRESGTRRDQVRPSNSRQPCAPALQSTAEAPCARALHQAGLQPTQRAWLRQPQLARASCLVPPPGGPLTAAWTQPAPGTAP